MDKSIILLLIFSVILSALSFFLGYYRPAKSFSWLAKLSFFFVTAILIPVLFLVLVFQSSAQSRLSKTGFVPYPGITEAVGISFGTGKNPVWMFKIKGENRIRDFYSVESNRPGWKLIQSDGNIDLYQKGNNKMSVGQQKGLTSSSIIYMLEEN